MLDTVQVAIVDAVSNCLSPFVLDFTPRRVHNVDMWIVTKRRLREYWASHPDTKSWLENWCKIAAGAQWRTIEDVRRTFPHADLVRVGSGKSATVFNVCGNKHRMATAIHYNTGKVFVLELMSHAEYSKNQWKDRL